MKEIILASMSPRRKEILELIGIPFRVVVSHVEEKIANLPPVEVVQDLAGLTTPLSFLSIGVTLSLGLVAKKAYLFSAVALRLVIIPAIFVPLGVLLGFRGQELCALMILFAAPTAVSSYPMVVAMDADGDFAAQMVAYTTVLCLPTIFVLTLILNTLGLM